MTTQAEALDYCDRMREEGRRCQFKSLMGWICENGGEQTCTVEVEEGVTISTYLFAGETFVVREDLRGRYSSKWQFFVPLDDMDGTWTGTKAALAARLEAKQC